MKRFLWLLGLVVAGAGVGVGTASGSPPAKTVDIDQEAEDSMAAPPTPSESNGQEAQQGSENAAIEPVIPVNQKGAHRVPRPPAANAQPTPIVPPGQDYTVKHGDTLWDISGSYLQSPWFWPKLWSYNPQIANPNWIYPGNDVHFYPGSGAQPGNGEPQGQGQQPEMMIIDDDVTVQGKIGYVSPRVVLVPVEGFITPKELAEAGRVSGAIGPKELLTALDIIYLTFDQLKPKAGDDFVIFRTVSEVYHPVTGELLGYLTLLRGTAKITRPGPPMYTAEIERSFNTVERGDLVGPYGEKFRRNVARKENDRTLDGFIVATYVRDLVNIGQDHMVFIDRGRRDGVQEGNEFSVLVRRDGLEFDYKERWMKGYPIETIGKLLIVDTKETASEALVVNSSRELVVGDHIEMLAGR